MLARDALFLLPSCILPLASCPLLFEGPGSSLVARQGPPGALFLVLAAGLRVWTLSWPEDYKKALARHHRGRPSSQNYHPIRETAAVGQGGWFSRQSLFLEGLANDCVRAPRHVRLRLMVCRIGEMLQALGMPEKAAGLERAWRAMLQSHRRDLPISCLCPSIQRASPGLPRVELNREFCRGRSTAQPE